MTFKLLGDYFFEDKNLDLFFPLLPKLEIDPLSDFEKLDLLFDELVLLIQKQEGPVFLLPALLHLFETINQKKWLSEPITVVFFEFWLNQFSNLSLDEQLKIRGKISGKQLPRDAYQFFFPIGMNKYYPGSHFVCAHLSPDIDTTIASFIGWLDAFSAKVSLGQHIWSLPGGSFEPALNELFHRLWGINSFNQIASTTPNLALKAIDLISKKNVQEVEATTSMMKIESKLHENAILLIDENGQFLGDWHSKDAEKVRPVIQLFQAILRCFESDFYIRILRFFANKQVDLTKALDVYQETFKSLINNLEAFCEMSPDEQEKLDIFLKNVIKLPLGINGCINDLISALSALNLDQFHQFRNRVQKLEHVFNESGKLIEERPFIFLTIEDLISSLDKALSECRIFAEQLIVGFQLKTHLHEKTPLALSLSSTFEEIKTKIESQDFLPVIKDNSCVGVVRKNTLTRYPLGTVSLRDFSNFDEINMAGYLNVISVIDHHKSVLETASPPLIFIGDAQSCNTLIAELLLTLNETYQKDYPIAKSRIIAEYLSCLQAILDDTDFLSKVSARDIDCVSRLLNQLKTLTTGHRIPCIELHDLVRDSTFNQKGALRILQNPDMFSLYSKMINLREKNIAEAIIYLAKDGFNTLTSDTKEQNGSTRIGQSKLFPDNFPLFATKKNDFQSMWLKKAQQIYEAHPDIALHLQMISTIPSASDLSCAKKTDLHTHLDELWIWIPSESSHGKTLLATFLNGMQGSLDIEKKVVKIEIFGQEISSWKAIFQHNFFPIPIAEQAFSQNFAVLYLKAGSLNSRKSMVSPYLPKKA